MKQFVVNHKMQTGEIRTILCTLDDKECTYVEKTYFNGKIYREDKVYLENEGDALLQYELALDVYSKYNVIKIE